MSDFSDSLRSKHSLLNLPNILSLFRIAVIPAYAIFMAYDTEHPILRLDYTFRYSPGRVATIILIVAAVTDLLDGYYARRWNIETVFGKLLDPLADKLLLMTGLIMLMDLNRVRAWLVIVLLSRELLITGLRGVAAGEGIIVAADKFGKIKYVFQLFGLGFLTWHGSFLELSAHEVGTVILYIALVISVLSGAKYLYDFILALRARQAE